MSAGRSKKSNIKKSKIKESKKRKVRNGEKNSMSEIKLGCHVGMAGKEMFLASAKEAASYGANVLCYTQEHHRIHEEKRYQN